MKNNWEETLKTLVVLSLFFLILFLITSKIYFLYMTLFFLVSGVFENKLAKSINRLWWGLSGILNKISTTVILFIVFYFVLTPVAFLWKIFNKKNREHFLKNNKDSYFYDLIHEFNKEYFEKMW